jgi:hypothetical protein
LPGELPGLIALWLPRLFKGALAFMLIGIVYRTMRPRAPKRGRYVRGIRLVVHRHVWLRKALQINHHKLRIGGVIYPRKFEPQHLLLSGSPGSGKSQTLHGTLDTLRARQDKVLITDIGGEALSRFALEGDLLLNPLDARSVAWSPFAELEGPADADRLAKSMVPDRDAGSGEHEWFVYSQALIACTRERSDLKLGLSPRAGQGLLRAAQAWAYLAGRAAVLPEDVQAVLPAVVGHRLERREPGGSADGELIGGEILRAVPVPL